MDIIKIETLPYPLRVKVCDFLEKEKRKKEKAPKPPIKEGKYIYWRRIKYISDISSSIEDEFSYDTNINVHVLMENTDDGDGYLNFYVLNVAEGATETKDGAMLFKKNKTNTNWSSLGRAYFPSDGDGRSLIYGGTTQETIRAAETFVASHNSQLLDSCINELSSIKNTLKLLKQFASLQTISGRGIAIK